MRSDFGTVQQARRWGLIEMAGDDDDRHTFMIDWLNGRALNHPDYLVWLDTQGTENVTTNEGVKK